MQKLTNWIGIGLILMTLFMGIMPGYIEFLVEHGVIHTDDRATIIPRNPGLVATTVTLTPISSWVLVYCIGESSRKIFDSLRRRWRQRFRHPRSFRRSSPNAHV